MWKAGPVTRRLVELLKTGLRQTGLTVADPAEWELPDSHHRWVVEKNKAHVVNCELMVAISTDPSIGLGAELFLRKIMALPTIGVFIKGQHVPAWTAHCAGQHWFLSPRINTKTIADLVAEIKLGIADK